ncbi:MAG: hypothetical protein V4675_06930 [Verrucomicrobiota bacterium]
MKFPIPLIAAFALLAGSAGALEITYSTSENTDARGHLRVKLPLFDPSRPEIPDNASLNGVRIEVSASSILLLAIARTDNATPSTLNAVAIFQWGGSQLLGSSLFSAVDAVPFSAGIFPGSATVPTTATMVFQGATNPSFMPGTIDGWPNEFLFIDLNVSARIEPVEPFLTRDSGFLGFASLDMLGVRADSKVTYIYGVPDGGSTLPLLLAGLVSCRLMRRPKI